MKKSDAVTKRESRAEHVFSLVQTFWPVQEKAKPNGLEAVKMCRKVAGLLYDAMDEADIPLQNAGCVLVCATATGKAKNIPFLASESPDSTDLEIVRLILHEKLVPVGIAFMLVDSENKKMLMRARGFEKTVRTENLLASVLEEWMSDARKGEMSTAIYN